jgi:hypothetical protein
VKLIDQTTLEELTLPNDLLWSDEFEWSQVVAVNGYTLTGALVIEQGVRLAGRPFTLTAEQDMAWVTRAVVQKLKDWAGYSGRKFKLIFEYPTDNRQFLVTFSHDSTPVTSRPVKGFPGHDNSDYFSVSLKFLEVPI